MSDKPSAGICDNCSVPKEKNIGGGSEPDMIVLWCEKTDSEIIPLPYIDQMELCFHHEPVKKTITNWINVLWVGPKKMASFHDTVEEAREELKEYPKTLFATTEPQEIEIEDIWS